MKDTLLYRSGDAFLPKQIVSVLNTYFIGNDKSRYYVNGWSFMHMLSGVLFAKYVSRSVMYALVAHTLWELWQVYIGMTRLDTHGLVDILNDTLFFLVGFVICKC